MTDTIESLRAERETALAEIAALRVQVRERDVALVEGVGGWLPKYRADKLEAERDAALAACAELRAALEHWTHIYSKALSPPGHDTYGEGMRDAKDQVRAILARTDLGRGMVAVPRETLERVRKALVSHETCGVDCYMAAVADLDALLDGGKKGGG